MAKAVWHSEALEVIALRKQRRVGGAFLGVGAMAFLCGLLLAKLGPLVVVVFVLSFVAMLIGSLLMASARRDPDSRGGAVGTVEVDADRIVVTSERARLAVPRAHVTGGWVEADAGITAVLEIRGGTLVAVPLESRAAAESLLAAVGAEAKAVALSVAASAPSVRALAAGGLFASVLAIPYAFILAYELVTGRAGLEWLTLGAGVTAVALGVTILALRSLALGTVVLGSEGIRVMRTARRTRYLAHGDLETIASSGNRVRFSANGDTVDVRCESETSAQNLASLARAAQVAHASGERAPQIAELDREGRSVASWMERLALLLDHESGYRRGAVDREQLLRIAEDPAEVVERRVGAALALAPGVDEQERDKLRVAADLCADTALAAALEQAAEGEIDATIIERASRSLAR